MDRGPNVATAPRNTNQRLSHSGTVGEAQLAANQASNRASINYSRPMSPQNTPTASSLAGGRVRSPLQSSNVAGLPVDEAERIMGSLQATAARPVKKKKKLVSKPAAEGSHLAAGTSGGPARVAQTSPEPTRLVSNALQMPSSADVTPQAENSSGHAPPRTKKKKKNVIATNDKLKQDRDEGFGNAYPSDTDSVISDVSSTTDRPRQYNTRAAGLLVKQPSIVREDREGEEKAERRLPIAKPAPQKIANGNLGSGVPANTSRVVSKERQHTRSASQADAQQAKILPSPDVPGAQLTTSLSPIRAARFSAQPVYETPDGTKHQPLGRSVSPAKSALKHSPSRGQSPLVDRGKGLAPSEASDTSGLSDEGRKSNSRKKKSVRVSFDEDSVVVGHAASPVTTDSPVILSPQNKLKPRTWLDLVRDKRLSNEDPYPEEEDTSIKPTPVLPSFGSVRGRKEQDAASPDKSAIALDEGNQSASGTLGISSDQGIGAILSQAAVEIGNHGILAASSKSQNEPLPPDINPIEGTNHKIDEGPTSDRILLTSQPTSKDGKHISVTDSPIDKADIAPRPSGLVPSIAVMPATPGVDEGLSNRDSWLGMPGGFPRGPKQEKESSETVTVPSSDDPSKTDSTAAEDPHDGPLTASNIENHSPVITPATVGIAEPETEAVAALHEPGSPHVGEVAETLRTQIDSHSGEESADDGSIYSDAAEDQTETEGDGFGSINAIVESPASPNFTATGRSPPASPTPHGSKVKAKRPAPTRNESEISEPAAEEGWDRAQAYWSGLSQNRRQQLEHAAQPGAVDEPIIPDRTMRGKESVAKRKKKKAKKPTPPSEQKDVPRQGLPENEYLGPGRKFAAAKPTGVTPTMRNTPLNADTGVHMRGSMRDDKPLKPAIRESSSRISTQTAPAEPRGTLQKKNRPVSAVPMIDYKSQATIGPNHLRAASDTGRMTSLTPVVARSKPTHAPKPKMIRSKSNGSDSDSSFKRMRSSAADTGRYTMKRSMRGSGAETGSSAPANRVSSLSMRTASPADASTRRPFSSVGPTGSGMRTSMRDSIDSNKPARMSLRGSMDSAKAGRTKSPSRFGFGLGSKSKNTDAKPASKATSTRSSRFQDSSDDEDGLPTMASSRFADSSDEEPDLAPVRGIPRRIDEGDSTDLEDSSTENMNARASGKSNDTAPTTVSAPSTKPEGLALASGSLRTPSGGNPPATSMGTGLQAKKAAEKGKKKRSFFGALGSRRKEDSSRVRKSDIESAARQDTALELTKEERTVKPDTTQKTDTAASITPSPSIAAPGLSSPAQSSPKSPKLQRRNTPNRLPSFNESPAWPLPQDAEGKNVTPVSTPASRPRTSDGGGSGSPTVTRPELGDRRLTVQSAVSTGKKKRFPMLRKALGLHD